MKEETCKLIEAVKKHEEGAFEQLYNEFYKLAYFFANKLCRNEADAKDAVQDTFIEVHRSIHTLKENNAQNIFLCGTFKNLSDST